MAFEWKFSQAEARLVDTRFEVRLPEGTWFDLWHTHVDWRGEGNHRSDLRRKCLAALHAGWLRVEAFATQLECPWQSWLVIDSNDSGQDAVYLHTPNPNRDNFSYRFEGVVWGATPPSWLMEFVAGDDIELGRSDYAGAELYWVRRASESA